MDPLSITASIIAVLQATNAVINVCYDYRSAVKNSSWELPRVIDEVISLRGVLEALERLAKKAESADPATESRLPTLKLLCERPAGPLVICLEELEALVKKLAPPSRSHAKSKRSALIAALGWPLKKEDTRKTLENIERLKNTLNLAIVEDQAALLLAIEDISGANSNTLQDVVKEVSAIRTDDHRNKIHKWLSAPDPWSNYENALRKRLSNTGTWFIESKKFADWKTTSNSFLWVYGIPGCGKTILCSTIIEDVRRHCQSNAAAVTVFFCFDFNDVEKQLHEKMMRSLVIQLSQTFENTPEALELLYSSCGDGHRQPSLETLLATFRQMTQEIGDVFIILDALDECNERPELLTDIKEMVSGDIPNSHVLVTSRREKDIEEAMQDLSCDLRKVCIQREVVNHDICNYVRNSLQKDPGLKRWRNNSKIKEEIETVLMSKVNGMFRWAVCQIHSLANCLNPRMLRNALASLPETLDSTYERILCNIEKEHHRYALTTLYWLCYSVRPVKLEEINEVIAVDIDECPRFDPDNRFPDLRDIWTICSSLVTLVPVASDAGNGDGDDDDQDRGSESYSGSDSPRSEVSNDNNTTRFEIRLAHFSVKEYLLSDRIGDGLAKQYRILEVDANASIADTCLAYLLHVGPLFAQENSQSIEQFPLAKYAVEYWAQHALVVEEITMECSPLTLEFLCADCDAFRYWVRFHSHTKHFSAEEPHRNFNPLYWASYAGLFASVGSLLDQGAEINASDGLLGTALQVASYENNMQIVQLLTKNGADVNAQGGHYGNALQAAAWRGNDKIVRLLLDHGADVNAQGGHFGNALQAAAAAWSENDKIVRLLLDHEADVNAQGGHYGNALQAAAWRGNDKIVRLLLDHGADVNAQGDHYGNALQAAASIGNDKIVRLLLDHEADVNAQGGEYGNALQAAASIENDKIVRLLLDHGADVNAQGGRYGNALQAAASIENDKIVRLLLDHEADVNAQGDRYGNALQAAAWRGNDKIVRLLLDHEADVNAQGGHYGNALQTAAWSGNNKIVRLLLDHEADVNAQGGHFGNALQAAAWRGNDKIVRLLLDHEADVNAQGGHYGNALQAAAWSGNDKIVRLLLDHEADVNAQDDHYGNALQAAASRGNDKIVRLLLDHEADVNAQGGHYGNALQAAAAAWSENDKIVRLLLDHEADVNAQDGHFGNALQAAAAAWSENDKIVRLLLDHGADVNAQGGHYGNALQAAAWDGNDKIVRLLLDHEADVNAQGGHYGNALQAAAWGGNDKIVRLLLDHEADVNAQGDDFGNALRAAAFGENDKIVRLLLDHGADINAQGGRYGNAINAAAWGGKFQIFQLLLHNGANAYVKGGEHGGAMETALARRKKGIIEVLLGVATANLRKKLADTTADVPREPVYEVDTRKDILAYWWSSAPDPGSETSSKS